MITELRTGEILSHGPPLLAGEARPKLPYPRSVASELVDLYDIWLRQDQAGGAIDSFQAVRKHVKHIGTEGLRTATLHHGDIGITLGIADGMLDQIVLATQIAHDLNGLRKPSPERTLSIDLLKRVSTIFAHHQPSLATVAFYKPGDHLIDMAGIRTTESESYVRLMMQWPKFDMLSQIHAMKQWPQRSPRDSVRYVAHLQQIGQEIITRIEDERCNKFERETLRRRLFELEALGLLHEANEVGLDGGWIMPSSNRLAIGRYRPLGDDARFNMHITYPQSDVTLPLSVTQSDTPERRHHLLVVGRPDLYPMGRPPEEREIGTIALRLTEKEFGFGQSRRQFLAGKVRDVLRAVAA